MRAYKANMIPGGVTPTINVSQYDNDYAVTVTLIEGAEIYTPPVGATVRVEGTKPDGHGFEYACTYQGNVVTMPIYTQMTVVAGRFPIELVVYQNGLRVGSCNIIFAVEKAPLGEDTDISETVIPDIIAGAQAQADAAAASAASAAEAAAQVLSSQIVTDASGSIASFSDGADDIPMQSLIAEITPVQSGSGDPSPTNIRPISGRTGMTVTRSGKNLLKMPTYAEIQAAPNVANYRSVTLHLAPNTTYYLSTKFLNGYTAKGTGIYALLTNSATRNEPWRAIAHSGNDAGKIDGTMATGADGLLWSRFYGQTEEKLNELYANSEIQLEVGSTATPYTPYAALTTYPINWQTEAGTIYGGTLNVTTGVLTVDKALTTFDGTGVTWEKYTPSSGNYCFRTTISDKAVGLTPMYANSYKALTEPAWGTSDYGVFSGHATLPQVYFRPPNASVAEVADWNTWLAANNLQVVYPLATPTTYQLTPIEIKTLLGGNTIYTDAGEVSVEYVADTKLYIDNKIAELQALVLEN